MTDSFSQGHQRRPRYRGTHPQRFMERYKERDPARYPDMEAHIRAQGRTPAGGHVPVLLDAVMAALDPKPGETVADVTIGYGGHAAEFLKRIGPGGRLLGMDRDGVELEKAGSRLEAFVASVTLAHGNFAGLGRAAARAGFPVLDILFADLGVSSMQLDDPARGFSHKHDGPLDMRMDPAGRHTAADVLAAISEVDLAAALRDLADEPDAARIARAIVVAWSARPILRTTELAALVCAEKGVSGRPGGDFARGAHPAARTFQTLRMLVNREGENLAALLRDANYLLAPGGRIGIISFHSGEDRRVKRAFLDGLAAGVYRMVAESPVRAGPEEVRSNPRARPAKFRWAVRTSSPGDARP
ncbi:MAG: 16S rRNA (cytosine(1402)-N(4))-methyltransferase RsmH [Planctomycetota bacterium]